jgi:hypothetical protein
VRRAIPFAVCVLMFIGCTDGSSDSIRKPAKVPIPQVSLPNGTPLALDARAWTKSWRTTPGSTRTQCVHVANRNAVKSGQFIVSPFTAFI